MIKVDTELKRIQQYSKQRNHLEDSSIMNEEELLMEQEYIIRMEIEDEDLTKDIVRETIKVDGDKSIQYFISKIVGAVNREYVMVVELDDIESYYNHQLSGEENKSVFLENSDR